MMKFAILLSSVLSALEAVKGEQIRINWIIPDTDDPVKFPDKFKVGDEIIFEWGGFHNVAIHPAGGCDMTDSDILGSTSPVTYTITEEDVGTKTFACDIGNHCARGQIIEATITSDAADAVEPEPDPVDEMPKGKEIVVNWIIPDTDDPVKFPDKFEVGDTIVFDWEGFHNVVIHPAGGCDTTDADVLGDTSPISYLFTEEDVGTKTFACDIGNHCQRGQIIEATIVPAGSMGDSMEDTQKDDMMDTGKDEMKDTDKDEMKDMDKDEMKDMDKDEMKDMDKDMDKDEMAEPVGELTEKESESMDSSTFQYSKAFQNILAASVLVQVVLFV